VAENNRFVHVCAAAISFVVVPVKPFCEKSRIETFIN
jgi:hypothetical protein